MILTRIEKLFARESEVFAIFAADKGRIKVRRNSGSHSELAAATRKLEEDIRIESADARCIKISSVSVTTNDATHFTHWQRVKPRVLGPVACGRGQRHGR